MNFKSKFLRKDKGITLIALVITIIVLLILAGVAISMLTGENGIITKTNSAKMETEGKAEIEKIKLAYLASLMSKYGEIDYNVLNNEISNITGKNSTITELPTLIKVNDNNYKLLQDGTVEIFDLGKASVGKIVDVRSTIDGGMWSSDNPVIPVGFKAINVETEGHESYWDNEDGPQVSEGLVISDGINEFVWIPVRDLNKFARLQSTTSNNYRGVLYNWSEDITGNTEYEWSKTEIKYMEPVNIAADSASTEYQERFNSMVESIETYGGFYIGRYETSLKDNIAQSALGKTPMNSKTWYKMYDCSKQYAASNSALGVTSEMMWGCQRDAMIKFILEGAEADHIESTSNAKHNLSSAYLTGSAPNDIASNIFDLEGNVSETTQVAKDNYGRLVMGGQYNVNFYKIYQNCGSVMPSASASSESGSRLSIYVDV